MCVLALAVVPLVGCSETAGDGGAGGDGGGGMGGDGGVGGGSAITPGLWLGGDPASNTDGEEFDTGWAICLSVNETGSGLKPDSDCDIDGQEPDAVYFAEVSWKEDAGDEGKDCGANFGASTETLTEVPIVDNSFEIKLGDCTITGTFDGDTASGTASCLGLMFGCSLDGGWTADAPSGTGGVGGGVVTDCTGEETFTPCTYDGGDAWCWLEQCAAFDCSGLEDGTYCEFAVLGDGTKGVCEAGECTKPEDCTGLADGVNCAGEDFGFCEGGECVAPP
jgi:hypothetical protein